MDLLKRWFSHTDRKIEIKLQSGEVQQLTITNSMNSEDVEREIRSTIEQAEKKQ
jgi:hypothetical protein